MATHDQTLHPHTPAASSVPTLSILNPNPRRLPGPSLLHHLVAKTPSIASDAPAVDYLSPSGAKITLSYEQFHWSADVLASRITTAASSQQPGAGPGVVPVLLPQCPELYVSQLAILKAGGAFCPLNLDAPSDRIKFILKDVDTRVVITTPELRSKFDGIDHVRFITVDQNLHKERPTSDNPTAYQPGPSDLAYVMYTSGSTGTPKGVGISHDAAAQSLLAHDRHIPKFSRFLQFAAPTFDVSVFEIFFPFLRGATLVSCHRAELLSDLPAVLTCMNVDACELTPTVAGSLLRKRESAPRLRLLLTIGEMLQEPVVREFGGGTDKESMLWAMYGPTEATIHCTLEPAFAAGAKPANIGFPLDTVSAFILREAAAGDNNADEPEVLPLGEAGELAVGGHQLAAGYINRPEQTAAAFVETREHGRLYRTGDRARMLPGGRIECMGRISDGQVKLRGQRIELGEIEHAALRTGGCHGAVASVVAGILVLFCTVDARDGMDVRVLDSCRAWLPRFMVPGDVVLMRDFPRLPSGKVDRKRLVADYTASSRKEESAGESVTYADELEREVCDLATSVLGVEVSPSSVLAVSGLDSLVAIKFAAALRKVGRDVSAVDVLNARTAHDLYMHIKREKRESPEVWMPDAAVDRGVVAVALAVNEATISYAHACTPLQSSMLAETARNSQAYCNWVELSFHAECSAEQIRSCVRQVAQKNDILRSGFLYLDGRFVQVVWHDLLPTQVREVDRLDREYQLDSDGLLRPFDVQVCDSVEGLERRVLVRIHHSLYDGWTLDLIIMDLNALLGGEDVSDRTQFRDLAAYQNTAAASGAAEAAKQFWAENLLGFQPSATLELQPKHIVTDEVLTRRVQIGVDASRVKALSDSLQCSPQTLFQAGIVWLWSMLTGESDVSIGTVTSGRTLGLPGIESIMGPCMDTAPLRIVLSQVRSVCELIENIHALNRAMLPHSSLPLGEIKKAAGISASQNLYDLLFVYQESLYSTARGGGPVREVAHQDFLETGLLIEVEPTSAGITCSATYLLASWPDAQVRVLQEQYQHVVGFMLDHLDSELSSLTNTFPAEMLSKYNDQPAPYTGCANLAGLVEATVSRKGDEPAVLFASSIEDGSMDAEVLSYRQLNELANQIGRHIQSFGVREGDVVAIIMEKSIPLYAGILAILKTGCAYLPLLPSAPIERVKLILDQSDTRFCLTDTKTGLLLRDKIPCPLADIGSVSLSQYPTSNIGTAVDPSRVANIIYTSGSTGTPKGVCVTQLNITSNLDVLARIYPPVPPNARLLQSCSQAFDVSVFEIFFSWSQGMCLCSAVNDTLFEDLERAMRMMQITHLSMTPTVAALADPANVPSVEFLVTSGEPMTAIVARNWVRQLHQGYGPSETTNICTVKKMAPGDVIRHLGHSFANTSSFVLRPGSLDIVPLGSVGEFCFGGDQVVQGYLHLPELTAERFIDHPEYGRLYRSGDMGRMLPDGSLMIIGRVDDQIKLRGQRIELNEINSVMSSAEQVTSAVTLLLTRQGSQQLATFYVPSSISASSFAFLEDSDDAARDRTQHLLSLLKSRLPTYMVPSYVLAVSSIPLIPAGKVDKDRLRGCFADLSDELLAACGDSAGPGAEEGEWSSEERSIAKTFADALGIEAESIGRWTPFPNLGVDSISAIKISKALARSLGTRAPVSAILQAGCVAQLSRAISSLALGNETPAFREGASTFFSQEALAEITAQFERKGIAVEKVLPCMPLQEAMLASSTTPDAPYVEKMLFRLAVPLDTMKAAWREICKRQPILRTCFVTTQDAKRPIAQVVLRETCDGTWYTSTNSALSLEQWQSEHLQTLPCAIDSLRPPVSVSALEQHGEVLLSFVCHHALYDGVAMDRLLLEVEHLVKGLVLPAAPTYDAFLSYALDKSSSGDGFWSEHLANFSPTLLQATNGEWVGTKGFLSRQLSIPLSALEARSRSLGLSLLTASQSAWAVLLSLLQGTDDVCFGNVYSGRAVPVDGVEDLVAPCFNTLPIRLQLGNARRNIDLLKQVQKLNPDMLEHQFTPLRKILALTGTSGKGLFDTMLLLQMPSRELDAEVWRLEREDGDMDFALVCELTPDPRRDSVQVKLHYDRQYLSGSNVEAIYRLFSHIFDITLSQPSAHLVSVDNISHDLKDRLVKLELKFQRYCPSTDSTLKNDKEQWNKTESLIRTTLARLASVSESQITHDMSIYQLGLDSISAVQIASSLRKQGLKVSATDVMEWPTCRELAGFSNTTSSQETELGDSLFDLGQFRKEVESTIRQAIPSDTVIESILPCTSLQDGLITEFVRSQGEAYFNFVDMVAHPDLTIDALVNAWKAVVCKTPMLRTGFVSVNNTLSAYAMAQVSSDTTEPCIAVVRSPDAGHFSLDKWRLDMTHRALSYLERPPWGLTVVDDEKKMSMHLAIHHALYDASSLQFIFNRVAQAIRGDSLQDDHSTEGAVLAILEGSSARTLERQPFWQDHASKATVSKFPTLTPLRMNERNVQVSTKISKHSYRALELSASNAGVTMQAAIQAAWTRILASYIGESSVTFGVVLSGRNTDKTLDAAFPCITTLPVVAEHKQSNTELLRAMMDYNGQLHKYQHVPLNRIQQWLGHPGSQLFDTLIAFQKLEVPGSRSLPWEVVSDQGTVEYPVSIEIEPRADHLHYRVTFFDDIIPLAHAGLLLEQFDAILSHLLLSSDGTEDTLSQNDEDLFAITPAIEPYLKSEATLLHHFVEYTAQRIPEKTALQFVTSFEGNKCYDKTWTFEQLNKHGDKVAHMLSKYVQPNQIVAICFDKCPEAHFAILGILKAGCAFVALDPGAPASRQDFILKDSKASVLLVQSGTADKFNFNARVHTVEINEEELSSMPTSRPFLADSLSPSSACYCLYTSGTTGTPKGCIITHENAVQAMLAFQVLFTNHWEEFSKWLQFASFHFDVSVLEQYWTWSVGITLVGAPRDLILEDLAGTISRLEITHIDLTPSLARLLHPDDVPSLCRGVFITGGEQLKQEILDAWGDKAVIHNFYGPTEATIGVTSFPCVPRNGRASNIGRQFPNVGTYVLRPGSEEPVLRGGVGELCVAGKLVGQGYLNREDLTDERFPTLLRFNERVYRTGDLVRILHDGCFDFLGRADDQVKLRGQRLEIGEINHAIRKGVPLISDVATMVVRKEKLQKDFLVAFVVAGESSRRDELQIITNEAEDISGQVQQACREKLPPYMVPTYVLQLPFIPLSANNKAEFKVLKALFEATPLDQLVSSKSHIDKVEQFDQVGQAIARALQAMGVINEDEAIGQSSSIFDLGIDSISVARFASCLKREGLQASPSTILKNPNLGQLLRAINAETSSKQIYSVLESQLLVQACRHRHQGFVCATLGISPDMVEYIAPCTALQQGMISRSRSEEHHGTYFNTFQFRLADHVSLDRLRNSWQKLVDTYSILRTQFIETTEGFVQVALRGFLVPWLESELPENNLADGISNMQQRWVASNQEHIRQPFQCVILRESKSYILLVNIFHALYDANSFDLLLQELAAEYSGTRKEPPGPTFFEALLHGPLRSFEPSRPFWEEHLRTANFQAFGPLSTEPTQKPLHLIRSIPFERLASACKVIGVTNSSLVQALWGTVLQNHCEDVTIGLILSGRMIDLDGADNVMGPLFNTVPFHMVKDGQHTWGSLAKQCHEFTASILPFQHVALRDIQKWCAKGTQLFDTLFSFQRQDTSISAVGSNLWAEVEAETNPDYPLAFEAVLKHDGELQITLVAQAGMGDDESLRKLLDEFEANAVIAADNPESVIRLRAIKNGTWNHLELSAKSGSHGNGPVNEAQNRFQWSETSERIRREIASLAQVPETSVHESTSLLELGLDSIDTIKLSARLKKSGVALANSQLIKGQTIKAFMHMLDKAEDTSSSSVHNGTDFQKTDTLALLQTQLAKEGHDLRDAEAVLPPTPLQEAMVAEMIQSDFRRYFNHDIMELPHSIDIDQLKQSWQQVVENSPILRTGFVEVDNPSAQFTYCQVVNSQVSGLFNETDIDHIDELVAVTESARDKAEKGAGKTGLLQLTVVKLRDCRYLVLSIAHALYDGWSLGLLHRDVEAAYRGQKQEVRQSPTGYLNQILKSSNPEAQAFWADYLSGVHPTHVESNQSSSSTPKSTHRVEAASKVSATTLRNFAKTQAVSLQVLGQAAWAIVLSTLARSLDVTFGVVLSGRDSEDAEQLMFPTMNTVAVRAILHGKVSSLLRYMQEKMADISLFKHYPLRQAQKATSDPRGLFNTLFILQQTPPNTGKSDSEKVMKSIDGISDVEYPVCVEAELVHDSLIWRVACADNYFSSRDSHRLLHLLDLALGFMAQSPSAEVLEFTEDGLSVCSLPKFQPKLTESPPENSVGSASSASGGDDIIGKGRSALEESIVAVLAEVAGVDAPTVNISQSIYNLGLDSISAIKASSLLRRKGIAITVRTMLNAKSIRHMAEGMSDPRVQLETRTSQPVSAHDPLEALNLQALFRKAGIPLDAVEHAFPATPQQIHMLSVWQRTDGSVFFPTFSYTLSGVTNLSKIAGAWQRILAEFSALRMNFVVTNDTAIPMIGIVCKSDPKNDIEKEDNTSQNWTQLSATQNLVHPLVLFSIKRQTAHSWRLKLQIHHALYDAVSLPCIMTRFKQLCSGHKLDSIDDGFGPWQELSFLRLSREHVDERRKFWTNYLESADLSEHFSRMTANLEPVDDFSRGSNYRESAFTNMEQLTEASAVHGVSIQALFFACYARVLAARAAARGWGLLKKIVFGVYLANREATGEKTQPALPTLALVPLLVHVAEGGNLIKNAKQVQQDLYEISSPVNVAVGLWEIYQWSGIKIDTFVNFLTVPPQEENGHTAGDSISLDEVPGAHEPLDMASKPYNYPWLSGNEVKEAYPDAVDVEVAVRNKALDIGVFGASDRLGIGGAAELIDSIVGVLHSVGDII